MNLNDIYEYILIDVLQYVSFPSTKEEYSVNTIFDFPKSYNFLFETLWNSQDFRSLSFSVNKYYKPKLEIKEEEKDNLVLEMEQKLKNRIIHSISLYFLGIVIAEKIGFKHFRLPQWEADEKRNFYHHWSVMCLFHDIGYAFELENKIDLYRTLDDLSKELNMKYRFDYDCKSELIQHYYQYCIEKRNVADHGIIGAMLLYDSISRSYYKKEEIANSAYVFSQKPIIGDHILEARNILSDCIAKHNMWFAKENQYDLYKVSKICELIPKPDNSHRRAFSNTPLLFLLCLVDAIEPIKANNYVDISGLLTNTKFDIESNDGMIKIRIHSKSCVLKMIEALDWLNVTFDSTTGWLMFNIQEQ